MPCDGAASDIRPSGIRSATQRGITLTLAYLEQLNSLLFVDPLHHALQDAYGRRVRRIRCCGGPSGTHLPVSVNVPGLVRPQ